MTNRKSSLERHGLMEKTSGCLVTAEAGRDAQEGFSFALSEIKAAIRFYERRGWNWLPVVAFLSDRYLD